MGFARSDASTFASRTGLLVDFEQPQTFYTETGIGSAFPELSCGLLLKLKEIEQVELRTVMEQFLVTKLSL
jgi:hypothetical protein